MSLTETLTRDEVACLRAIWPPMFDQNLHRVQYGTFVNYIFDTYKSSVSPNESLVVRAVALIDVVRANSDQPLSTILDKLQVKLSASEWSDINVTRLARFLVEIWLPLRVKIPPFKAVPGEQPVVWEMHKSLVTLIRETFPLAIPLNQDDATARRHIPQWFDIPYLVKYYNWTVKWTSNLVEHLTVDWSSSSPTITIYRHKVCLYMHSQYRQHSPISQEFLEETLDTLNLLFPPSKKSTITFLNDCGQPFHRLGYVNRNAYHDLQHYVYWQKRLTQILTVLNEPPYRWRQLGLGNNWTNLKEFLTFWIIGIVAVSLAIGFGISSTYFAAKGYDVAVASYNLALAQACAMPGANVTLPVFCK